MKSIRLPTGRPYDWRLFWVLFGLNVPAAFAVVPFAMNLQRAYGTPGTEGPPEWGPIIGDRIVTLAVIALLAGIGLALANRIGLGLPFVESRIQGVPPPRRFRGILAVGALVGIGGAAVILALDFGVFRSRMLDMVQELSIETPEEAMAPPLVGFLAAISAGVTEETSFRLFGLTLLAWLGGRLVRTTDDRPPAWVLWTANILFALVFGATHLTTAHAIGWPMNTLVLTRTFVLNGIGGMAFGWLFWTYGLESAMLAHFFTDIGLYTLLPVIVLQEGRVATTVAGCIVTLVVGLGVIWAARTVAREDSEAA